MRRDWRYRPDRTDVAALARSWKPDGYIEPTAAGETITWGSWSPKPNSVCTMPITHFPYASGSDYSGNTVEASNYRVLSDDAHVMRRSVLIDGGHGTFGIAFIGAPTRLIRGIVGSLETYPLLDADDHSHLEMELEHEQWDDWGRDEFRREIANTFDWVEDPLTDDELDHTWCSFAEHHGDGGRVFEQGDSCHFYIDDAIAWLKRTRVIGPFLVVGNVTYQKRHVLDVARDAGIEGRDVAVIREILTELSDCSLVELPVDDDDDEQADCDECGDSQSTVYVDSAAITANVCAACVPSAHAGAL